MFSNKTLTFVVITTFFLSTSCASTRVIKPQPDTIQNELKRGDRVKVVTKGGSSFKFRISDINSEAIIGRILRQGRPVGPDNIQILFTEIAKIEEMKQDTVAILAVFAVGFLVAAGLILNSIHVQPQL